MKLALNTMKTFGLSLVLASAFITQPVLANGPIGEHVNHLKANLKDYSDDVEWMIAKVDALVTEYEKNGAKAVKSDDLIEYWESVKFHSAIETNYVPVYASIWQSIYGIKMAIDDKKPASEVRQHQQALDAALWQGLGAVKLAADFQQKGLLKAVKATASENMTQSATIDEIKQECVPNDSIMIRYQPLCSVIVCTDISSKCSLAAAGGTGAVKAAADGPLLLSGHNMAELVG